MILVCTFRAYSDVVTAVAMTKALLRDHDLAAHDDRERNLNLFMTHIGKYHRLWRCGPEF